MTENMETVIPTKRGRPAKGRDPLISVRLPAALVKDIEEWMALYGVDRSTAIRCLLGLGLSTPPKKALSVVDPKHPGRGEIIGRKEYRPKVKPKPKPAEAKAPEPTKPRVGSAEWVRAAADRAEAKMRL